MSITLNTLLSAALVLGTASGALAASQHPARHTDRTTVQRNLIAPGNYASPGRFAYPGYNGYAGLNAYAAGYNYNAARNAYDSYNGGRDAFDYANTVPRGETYIYIQDKGYRDSQ